jgi:hypothetical protein
LSLGGFADQGLLYHWVKYHRKSYTHVFPTILEDWGPDKLGNVTMISENPNKLPSCLPSLYDSMTRTGRQAIFTHSAPYRDFMHFTGKKKPWAKNVGQQMLDNENMTKYPARKTSIYWAQTFEKVMRKLNLNITFADVLHTDSAPLGKVPLLKDAMKHHETFSAGG